MRIRPLEILDLSYLNLRLCIGILGVTLPFILRIGSWIFPPHPYSVSAYYYSAMRNPLVASLCALGIFLITYRGYDALDTWITNICGAATIGVAFFPTSNPGFRPSWVGQVHPVVAGIALAGQALMALQFTQTKARTSWVADLRRLGLALIFRYSMDSYAAGDLARARKLRHNRIYSACAWLIIIGVVLALVQNFWPASVKAQFQWLFLFESLSIVAFGVAWLVKGATLRPGGTPAVQEHTAAVRLAPAPETP